MSHRALDAAAIGTLTKMLGGDAESLRELVGDLVTEVSGRLAEAHAGIDTGDATLTGRAAHTLKSNALTFGALHMADLARQIETAARAGDLGAAAGLLPALEHAWANVQPSLLEVCEAA
jgi:HPt (histidine-containing phosphotransfer) domain-containing protein